MDKNTMICTVMPVERPKRKLIILRSQNAHGYWEFCEEKGCEWEGILNSIPEKMDFGSAIECVMKSHERYNPKEFGYEYDCENAPVFNFGASLEMGAKIAFPVKKC